MRREEEPRFQNPSITLRSTICPTKTVRKLESVRRRSREQMGFWRRSAALLSLLRVAGVVAALANSKCKLKSQYVEHIKNQSVRAHDRLDCCRASSARARESTSLIPANSCDSAHLSPHVLGCAPDNTLSSFFSA